MTLSAIAKRPQFMHMTDNQELQAEAVYAYEVSCLIRAHTEEEAFAKVHRMMAFADQYWVEQGGSVSHEEEARMPGPYPGFQLVVNGAVLHDTGSQSRPRD
jgi:hypothetical protein